LVACLKKLVVYREATKFHKINHLFQSLDDHKFLVETCSRVNHIKLNNLSCW